MKRRIEIEMKKGLFLYRGKDGFRWRLIGRNGKILAASTESFKRRAGALNNLRVTYNQLSRPIIDLTL